MRIAYDAPCHLHHAQGVVDAPLAILRAIPELDVCLPAGHEHCCGSAGLYSLDRPALEQLKTAIFTLAMRNSTPEQSG